MVAVSLDDLLEVVVLVLGPEAGGEDFDLVETREAGGFDPLFGK